MTIHVDVDRDLTVTVHDDGRITWSSSNPLNREGVERAVCYQRLCVERRLVELQQLQDVMNATPNKLTADAVLAALLEHPGPGIPALSATEQIGEVRLELQDYRNPRESSIIMATIAEALTQRGYACTRSRTRVTVRLAAPVPSREPDFVCTRGS
jgi:hypothetical protein